MPILQTNLPVITLAKYHVNASVQKPILQIRRIFLARFFSSSWVSFVSAKNLMAIGMKRLAERIYSVKIQSCKMKNRSPVVAIKLSNQFCLFTAKCLSFHITKQKQVPQNAQNKLRKISQTVTNVGISLQLRFMKMYIVVETQAILNSMRIEMITQSLTALKSWRKARISCYQPSHTLPSWPIYFYILINIQK